MDTKFFARETQLRRSAATHAEFLYFGNLTAGKRIDLWLRAFARVAGSRQQVHFTLVGDGPARSELERLSRELGIEPRVTFAGFRQRHESGLPGPRTFSFFRRVWGLVLVEAMAAGLPCIARACRRDRRPDTGGNHGVHGGYAT